jgi:hypothetical protein
MIMGPGPTWGDAVPMALFMHGTIAREQYHTGIVAALGLLVYRP